MATGRPALDDDVKLARGKRVLALRERLWGTQQKGADALGLERGTLSRWETGGYAFTTHEAPQRIADAMSRDGYAATESDVKAYIFGEIELDELLKRRQSREVFNADDPGQWASLVRAHGKIRGYDADEVESFIARECKGSALTRIDQIPLALDAFILGRVHGGDNFPAQKPPFLSVKRPKKN